jgi:hypothetical protein
MRIRNLIQTGTACPSQWDAESEDGRPVYIRYRWGTLTAEFWDMTNPPFNERGVFYAEPQGDPYDGVMTTEEMIDKIGFEVID